MTSVAEINLNQEFLRAIGSDGIEYTIRPFEWNLARVEEYYHKFEKYHIFSDDIPKDPEAFLVYIGSAGTLWFEAVRCSDEVSVGLMYLTDLRPSWTERRYISAFFHAITWDAKAAKRLPVAKAFIKTVFRIFGLHRLESAVPLKYGGAIRTLKRLGFKEEGTIREGRRYNGVWFNVLLLSILEHEVSDNGAGKTDNP